MTQWDINIIIKLTIWSHLENTRKSNQLSVRVTKEGNQIDSYKINIIKLKTFTYTNKTFWKV